jgi:hypothetical protein
MNDKRYVVRSAAIAARRLGDEMMIMSASNSTLFTLNDVATVIWESADGSSTLEDIVSKKICKRFDIGWEEALKDAETLVSGLAEYGLLLISNQPVSQIPSSQLQAR